MIPYPNRAQWWVIWVTVAVLWCFGPGMMAEENNPCWLMIAVIMTSLPLICRCSKQKEA